MSIKAIELNKKLSIILSDKKRAIKEHTLKNVCRIGEDKDTCRYIMRNQEDYVCVKNSIIQLTIDETVEKQGMVAKGNNCPGLINQEELVNGKEKSNQEESNQEESNQEESNQEESNQEEDNQEESNQKEDNQKEDNQKEVGKKSDKEEG